MISLNSHYPNINYPNNALSIKKMKIINILILKKMSQKVKKMLIGKILCKNTLEKCLVKNMRTNTAIMDLLM